MIVAKNRELEDSNSRTRLSKVNSNAIPTELSSRGIDRKNQGGPTVSKLKKVSLNHSKDNNTITTQ